MSLFFSKFVKLDPDPHGSAFILPTGSGSTFRKTAGSGSAKKECGSTALITTSHYAGCVHGTWTIFFKDLFLPLPWVLDYCTIILQRIRRRCRIRTREICQKSGAPPMSHHISKFYLLLHPLTKYSKATSNSFFTVEKAILWQWLAFWWMSYFKNS